MSLDRRAVRIMSFLGLVVLLAAPATAQHRRQRAASPQQRLLTADSQSGISPRIINGQPTEDYPAVGIVGSQSVGGFCSGTLISPSYVLTAGHCADFVLAVDTETNGTFELGGVIYHTSRVFIHPYYDPVSLDNDIAVLELSEAVTDVTPSLLYRDPPQVGQSLILVGFGSAGDASSGADGSFGTKLVGYTMIDDVQSTTISWHFDDPTESNTAPGDSGGPAYVDVGGELYIAGITSYGTKADASLGDVSTDTRVDAYADWVDMIVESATTPPQGGNGQGSCPGGTHDHGYGDSDDASGDEADESSETANPWHIAHSHRRPEVHPGAFGWREHPWSGPGSGLRGGASRREQAVLNEWEAALAEAEAWNGGPLDQQDLEQFMQAFELSREETSAQQQRQQPSWPERRFDQPGAVNVEFGDPRDQQDYGPGDFERARYGLPGYELPEWQGVSRRAGRR